VTGKNALAARARLALYRSPRESHGTWLALVGGVAIALAVVAAALPLLRRLTDPDTVRFD